MTQFECSETVREVKQNGAGDWREVDRRLGAIAKQRASLDAEEARWLREAARVKIWREVGCVSLLDYLERRLGYGPRAAQDRVRVALALEELPALEAALSNGMPYTAVRELTRVATRETEQDWIDACRGASVHEVEQVVSGHRKGSRPSDPAEPDLATRSLTFDDIAPSTIALLRQARQKVQEERGVHLSDNDLLAVAFGALISGGSSEERSGRAKFQIAMDLCPQCEHGWQKGAGRRFAMEKADVERAKCDAQYIGSLDGDPERATQDVPPRIRRFVFRRDGGRCRVPGCRSTTNLELHHLKARACGGSHEPNNLILLCDGCHATHHRGLIEIRGTADNLIVERRHPFEGARTHDVDGAHVGVGVGDADRVGGVDRPHVGMDSIDRAHVGVDPIDRAHVDAPTTPPSGPSILSKLERATIRTQALDALVRLGFKRHEARAAVDAAETHIDNSLYNLESFLRVALTKAPRPRTG